MQENVCLGGLASDPAAPSASTSGSRLPGNFRTLVPRERLLSPGEVVYGCSITVWGPIERLVNTTQLPGCCLGGLRC